MAKAVHVQKGQTIDYYNGEAAIGYGDIVPIVSRVAVAGEDIPAGATGSLQTEGVWEMPAVTNAAFAVGDALYWDATAGNLTKTASGNTPAGWCVESKATSTATAKIKIG